MVRSLKITAGVVVFGLVAIAIANIVKADTLDITWTAPTQRVDGTALTAAEIAGYQLAWSVKGVSQPVKTIPPGTAYTLDTGALYGKTCVTLATIDTDGLLSDPTPSVCRNAKPNPPSNLKVK